MWLMLLAVCLPAIACAAAAAGADPFNPEMRRSSMSLNGTWERLLEHEDDEVWRPEVAAAVTGWQQVTIPGSLLAPMRREQIVQARCVWARRGFILSAAQAAGGVVLNWNGIRYGPTVWVNGRLLEHHPPMGPHTILLPKGLLRAGPNLVLLKVQGWAGVPRSKSGYPLIPVGGGTQPWGTKEAAIEDDVWLDFYRAAYIRSALAMPDVPGGKVTFRVELASAGELPGKIELVARVGVAEGRSMGLGRAPAGDGPTDVTVPAPNLPPWTPESPRLCVAEVEARSGGVLCDRVAFRFGMRQVEVRDGRFLLNGKPLWLRGSNLVCEWRHGGPTGYFNQNVKAFIVDEARNMSLNSFRTHTLPPPKLWVDTGDEHGTMFLPEMPLLYNHADFQYTDAEREIVHANTLLDTSNWVRKLWNHPCVVVWVLSNESKDDNAWEKGPYWKHVKGLDPTRPAMRSGGPEGTPEVYDFHTCFNVGDPVEGGTIATFMRDAKARDPERTLCNTEYMNRYYDRNDYGLKWLGRSDRRDDRMIFAEFAAEHTEAMRRLRYDLILPYMYRGWTSLGAGSRRRRGRQWRDDFAQPISAALHSAMSPVLASLDLFDRNFEAGGEVDTVAAAINETHLPVSATLELYVTAKDPQFVPDQAALAAAVWRRSLPITLAPDSFTTRTVRWKVPAKEGSYFLAAVLRRSGARPVVSQRVVRAIDPSVTNAGLRPRPVVALGVSPAGRKWLQTRGLTCRTDFGEGALDGAVAAIWNADDLTPRQRADAAPKLLPFVSAGGRLVILDHAAWTWNELVDFQVRPRAGSRAFAYSGADHPMLAGVDAEFLKRLNGMPGTASAGVVEGDILGKCEKLLWVGDPQYPVAVRVPVGDGEIVVCLLDLKRRLPGGRGPHDPVAERIVLNLLAR